MVEYREGQTATNPKTGQKIVFQGGLWVAVAGGDRSASLKPIEQKRLDEVREAGSNALSTLGDLTRFQDVNTRLNETGYDTGGIKGWVADKANFLLNNPDVQQAKEITARMAPAQRVPGSGTTSDRDLALYLQASPSMTNSKAANDAIIERGRREAVLRQQRADFYEQYAREHGSINGAEQAFRGMVGRGSMENPYDAKTAGDRSQLPRGAYYQSPEGLRRNDNGPSGNPIIKPSMTGRPASPSKSSAKPSGGFRILSVED